MNLRKSIMKMFGAQMVKSAASFVGVIIFARFLGAHQLGIYFLFEGIVRSLNIPADLGLRGSLEKRISEDKNAAEMLSTTLLMKIMPVSIVVLGIIAFRSQLGEYVGRDLAGLMILTLLISEVYNVVIHLLRGELRVEKSAELIAMNQVLWVVIGVVFIWILDMGVMGLIYAYMLAMLLPFVYGVYLVSIPLGAPSVEAARSLFDYAKFDVIAGTGAQMFSWTDVLIIGYFLTQTDVGAYETAWRLSVSAVMFGIAIRSAIFPQFSNWSGSGDTRRIKDTLSTMITGSLFFVIPSFVGVLLLSSEILGIVFGEEFVIASTALVILMIHRLSQALDQTIGRTLQAIDRNDLAAYGSTVGIVLNVVLNVVLVSQFGIEGAATATLLSYAAMTIIRTKYLSKHVPVRPNVPDIGWCVFAAMVMGAVLFVVNTFVKVNTIYELVAIVVAGALIYLGVVLLSRSLRMKLFRGVRNTS